jgi:hypothetical protein
MKLRVVFLTPALLAVTLPVCAQTMAPDFLFEPNGTGTSVTVNAGQGAGFDLLLLPVNGFAGTVNINCAITPVVTPAPICILGMTSAQLIAPTEQQVPVTMSTIGPTTMSATHHLLFPPGPMPLAFTLMTLGLGWFLRKSRKRWTVLLSPAMTMTLAVCSSCGSSVQRTPPGIYTMAVTASSGTLSHSVPFQVKVN